MSNILPKEAHKAIWRIYRTRYIVAGLYVAIAAAMLAGLSLLPMYLALHSAEKAAASRQVKNSETQTEQTAVVRAQSLISVLSPFVAATTTPGKAIATALALRPKGVSVDHVLYSSGAKKGTIMLVGLASTREGTSAYQQALQSDAHFETVSIPVGDLVGTQGGRFSITLTGKF